MKKGKKFKTKYSKQKNQEKTYLAIEECWKMCVIKEIIIFKLAHLQRKMQGRGTNLKSQKAPTRRLLQTTIEHVKGVLMNIKG
jgi:hypothetical protein